MSYRLLEGDVAKTGVIDIRRDRGGTVGRPEHTGYEPRLPGVFGFEFIGDRAGEMRALTIQRIGPILQAIIGHGDSGRIEGIGLDDVGASLQIGAVDRADDIEYQSLENLRIKA
jgi:hypothetical protein